MFVVREATEPPLVFTQKQGRYLLGKLNLNVSWYPSLLFFPRSSGAVMPYRWGAETLEWSRCWWWWSWSYVMSDDHGGDAGREEARPKMLTFSSWWQWWGITAALRSSWCCDRVLTRVHPLPWWCMWSTLTRTVRRPGSTPGQGQSNPLTKESSWDN